MHHLIFELSFDYPPSMEKRSKKEDLEHFFFWNNPWFLEPFDCYLTLENFRKELINLLKKELPKGFRLKGETITLVDPEPYWQETISHLKAVSSKGTRDEMPLAWWKHDVCKYGQFFVYLRDTGELMTLHEFLLDSMWKDASTKSYGIGSIFEVTDD